MNIAFLARCGGDYGWGHWIRTLVLVDAVRTTRHADSITLIVDGPDRAIAIAREKLGSLEGLAFHTSHAVARDESWDVILIDRLEHDPADLAAWRTRCNKLAVFDDMGQLERGAHVIIRPQWLPTDQPDGILYGPKYFPVAQPWLALRETYRPETAHRLIVCLGGGTTNRAGYVLAAEALRRCKHIDPAKITFVLGYELGESDLPDHLRSTLDGVEIIAAADLPALMPHARLALIAGGFIKYDLAAAGIPSVILAGPHHQTLLAQSFAKTGAAVYAGQIDSLTTADLARPIERLFTNRDACRTHSNAAKTLIDGHGVERILGFLK